ncbi:UGSC family (seleno)protein [Saccharopolyspora mangrovi]|uniref:UGSC family (Seleno)protein n=1 Tax=Saccharopolyspora mangrovi TaxID=3082379 RepID=A0ABU6AC56_9PSEU|nr:UGSC family (seleno)protein [Saccharopolyspora sp. S2-29]MEB3369046.1 UGSC family (seleno)protein [Saccharopolyspora sp. S2-29]
MPNTILDPTGRASTAAAVGETKLAARPAELAGARIGLLENTKQNAGLLLTEIAELLRTEHGAAGVEIHRTKRLFAQPAPAELVAEYTGNCDVVVTGVGDCGSCSASAVADGLLFERAGLPAAVICSDAFVATADAMAELRGHPGYRYVTTAHPVAILTPEQVRQRARDVLPAVLALLTGAGS